MTRARLLILAVLVFAVLVLAAAVLVPSVRAAVLRPLGGLLLANDPLEPVDACAMTETGEGLELEVADLYQRRMCARVLILGQSPTAADLELARRGVDKEALLVDVLVRLGIRRESIARIDAGEGGTADSTRALALWVRANPSRVIAVVAATHARRYRRTLLRAWPAGVPAPRVTYPAATTFHAADWWTTRRNLRDGIFELQKLCWDVARHPW